MPWMDEALQGYIDSIAAGHRPLFDRLHRLILAVHPDVAVVLSYKIPTYKVGTAASTWASARRSTGCCACLALRSPTSASSRGARCAPRRLRGRGVNT